MIGAPIIMMQLIYYYYYYGVMLVNTSVCQLSGRGELSTLQNILNGECTALMLVG